jgi:hypothetical protein
VIAMPKSQNSDFPARLAVRLAMRRYLVPVLLLVRFILNGFHKGEGFSRVSTSHGMRRESCDSD